MEFILYFLLRRFFVKLKMDNGGICLSKGLLFRRIYYIPLSSVTAYEVKRTLLLRLFCGKKLTLLTLSGKVSFYLHKNESLPLSEATGGTVLCPKPASVLLGALIETRALSGTIIFSFTLYRIGSVFGSGYYDRLASLIDRTADGINELLSVFRLTVPKITAAIAIFIAAAWIFAFIRSILKLLNFRIFCGRNPTVTHGVVTLYERTVVRNNLTAAKVSESAATLVFKTSPIYAYSFMLLPPISCKKTAKALRVLLGFNIPKRYSVKPPKNALLGHIFIPSAFGAADMLMLILTYVFGNAPILRSLLWAGIALCLWYSVMFALFMLRSGAASGKAISACTARHGTRLLTLIFPTENEALRELSQNPFQRISGMYDLKFRVKGRSRLKLRNISEPL